jgi:hypothetical protein
MTLIICSNIDCMYAFKRKDGYYQCRCHALGITEEQKCNSYMVLPKDISKELLKPKTYKNGEPCSHPGCCNHLTHPCEKCGRIGCQGESNGNY